MTIDMRMVWRRTQIKDPVAKLVFARDGRKHQRDEVWLQKFQHLICSARTTVTNIRISALKNPDTFHHTAIMS